MVVADGVLDAALVPRGDFTWFLKMTGSTELLDREREGFASFLRSVRLPEVS